MFFCNAISPASVNFTNRSKLLRVPASVTFIGMCLQPFIGWLEFSFKLRYQLRVRCCIHTAFLSLSGDNCAC